MRGSTRAYGKCILLGEHSVVRGQRALVLPLGSRHLELSWERREGSGWELHAGDFAPAFRAALTEALRLSGATLPEGAWVFHLSSSVPPRAGLGSSAALSVAITRFLLELGLVKGDIFAFALQLENLFHGTSSGIDVAAVLAQAPIFFQRGHAPEPLPLRWRPHLYLADTGLRSATKACVEKVSALGRPDLDERMAGAVEKAARALSEEENLSTLQEAMEEGLNVFRAWGLVPPPVEEKIAELKRAGALAVKPTGSGDGGFLIALFRREASGLIPVWADS